MAADDNISVIKCISYLKTGKKILIHTQPKRFNNISANILN